MDDFEIFIIFMVASILLVNAAQKLRIPYPIVLVFGGMILGFLPMINRFDIDHNRILFIVLPPILYYGSFWLSNREFFKNWREIFSLALGLVIASTIIVAIIFKWLFPQFSWPLAFVFGAIVSPPDAVAATTILKRFSISNRLLTILEGESLINDASALVLYSLGLTALVSGSFSFYEGEIQFIKMVLGGILLGFVVGVTLQNFSKWFLEPIVGVMFSFIIPYMTYLLADRLGVSGVLAVVVTGLIGSHLIVTHHSSLRRLIGYISWDIFIVLLNCFVFILIGSQLSEITSGMTPSDLLSYTGYGIFVTFVLIVVRLLWVFGRCLIKYLFAKQISPAILKRMLKESTVIGWSGMRGIVSMAAALALPTNIAGGMPLAGREVVVFIVFIVILLSLLLPALTLPMLLKSLQTRHIKHAEVIQHVRKNLTGVAENELSHIHSLGHVNEEEYQFLSNYFKARSRIMEIATPESVNRHHMEEARLRVLQAQRQKLVNMWEEDKIDDLLLLQLSYEIDVEESHYMRAQMI